MNSLLLLMFLSTAITEAASAQSRECVILVHGLGRTPLSMLPVAWTLKKAGYHVVNLRYPSRRFRVGQLSENYLGRAVEQQTQAGFSRLHFVTHSLGGIVVRQYLATHTMTNLGRVVMLAPPNHGSKLADRLRKNVIGKWILGPAGCELGTSASDLPERLGPSHFPLGVISAMRDGKVPPDSAKLNGMADFLTVPGFHTWIMCRADTVQAVQNFIANGNFHTKTRQ